MKFDDAIWGALLMLLGGALLIHVQGFPAMPGQRVGPALFPGALGVGFAVLGLILFVRALLARASAADSVPWLVWPQWSRSPRHMLGFAMLIGVNALYLVAVDRLGFIIIGTIYLAALMWVLRVPPLRIVPCALVLTLLIHFCFYKLLRVPLPWGWLQPIAW